MFRIKKTVVHISIDGWRPETIEYMPNMLNIIKEGFFSLAHCDSEHSNTLPNHLSMLSSVPVSTHKWTTNFPNKSIRTNIHINKGSYQQSIFDNLNKNKLTSSIIVQKERLYRIILQSYPKVINEFINTDDHTFPTYKTKETINQVMNSIIKNRKNYYFIHLQGPDLLGHTDHLQKGESYRPWGFNPLNPNMIEVLRNIDKEIGNLFSLIKKYKGKMLLIISSDHGGTSDSNDHYLNPKDPQNSTIPMIIWGLKKKHKTDRLILNRYIGNFACNYLNIKKIPDSESEGYDLFTELNS